MTTYKKASWLKTPNGILLTLGFLLLTLVVISVPMFANAQVINRQLEIGMSGDDVAALQTFLAKDPSIYPQGLVTGYFGVLTKAAVANFQSRNNISAVGRVGPITLPVLNAQMLGGGITGIDLSSPAISNVSITKSTTTATINWNSGEQARGRVYYSTSPIRMTNTFEQTGIPSIEPTIVNGALAQTDTAERTSHSVNISGLTANTTYHYMVMVLDSSNNISVTLPNTFTTNQ